MIGALLLLAGPGLAEEASAPHWASGLPLGQVSVVAADGELPEEDLLPLLRAQQGVTFDPGLVRLDLGTLHGTGLFSAVEARVDEGVGFGADGAPRSVVWLSYEVLPAPQLRRVVLDGVRRLPARELRQAAGLSSGSRVDPELDPARVAGRVADRYRSEGFPSARVEVHFVDVADGLVDLVIEVDEGEPLRVGELRLGGELPLPARRLRLEAMAQGLWPGRRLDPSDLRRAQDRLTRLLRARGYPDARVRALTLPEENLLGVRVLLFIEPGNHVRVEVVDRGPLWDRRARRWLEEDLSGRLGPAVEDDLQRRLERALREAGHALARAEVEVVEGEGEDLVRVSLSPGPRHRIPPGGLTFSGAEAFSEDYLTQALAEASPAVIGRGRLTEEALAEGLEALAELYRSRGYLAARLEVESFSTAPGWPVGRVEARVRVDEGPQTQLRSLIILGEAPELVGRWQPRAVALSDGPFQPAEVRRLTEDILQTHRELGYSGADARSRTQLSEDGRFADTVIEVEAGEPLFLRGVIIRGTRRTRRRVIEREVQLERGEVIRPDDLAALRAELYALDTFSTVNLELQGEGDRLRDLVIEVSEQPAWAFEVGGGVATDEGVRAVARMTRRNIWGLAHSLSALGQLGYGYVGNEWRLDTTAPEWRAGLRYEAPTARQLVFVDVLLNEQEQEPTYRLLTTGADAGLELNPSRARQVVLSYGVQWRSLDDVDAGALVSPDPWLDVLGVKSATAEPIALPTGWRRQGGLSVLALSDQRDDRFNPRSGHLLSLHLEAYDVVSSGFWGARVSARGQQLLPLGPTTLELRGQGGLGGVRGRGETLALEDRFRLGGASTLRGYPLDSVGPKNAVAIDELTLPPQLEDLGRHLDRDHTERWVPTGGDAMLLATAELRVPLPVLGLDGWDGTELVGFVDVGNVFLLDPTVFTSSERIDPEPRVRYGVGVGIHQATPVGPLQVDLGLNPVYFQASWPEARGEVPLRLHVSLGAL